MSFGKLFVLLAAAFALVLVLAASDVEAKPTELMKKEEGGMSDALKYLEELDKYYSQVARPRERRVGQNMATALERLSQIKNYYNEAGRPRFGKRSSGIPIEVLLQNLERWRK